MAFFILLMNTGLGVRFGKGCLYKERAGWGLPVLKNKLDHFLAWVLHSFFLVWGLERWLQYYL
jgi:hypothetical protein